MLSPETRAVAIDFLRPAPGYRLARCLLTTYSLDLEALLALPLAVLSQADAGLDEILGDPLLLLEALREAGERVHVFVDQGGIAIPRTQRSVYAMLESSVHPVRRAGGAFHPKVWLARFEGEGLEPLLRVAILSRNLTFDRSWDIALSSEATPQGKRRKRESRELGEFIRSLPAIALAALPVSVRALVDELASDVERCVFPAPGNDSEVVSFHALGLDGAGKRLWAPRADGLRLLAISPFLSKTAVEYLAGIVDGQRLLISRQEALDALPAATLEPWGDQVYVMCDGADGEQEDTQVDRPSGLHAKLVCIEHGRKATWFVGSANLTEAAYRGRNVEVMASISSGKWRGGIDKFVESGFLKLCEPYRRAEGVEVSPEMQAAAEKLEAARRALFEDGALQVECAPAGAEYSWQLAGKVHLPEGVEVHAWPVSVSEDQARVLELPVTLTLPADRLTAFVAFRLRCPGVKVDDVRLTLLLPASGLPEDRLSQVLRSLIDTPERFLRFLRALLGGLDGMVDWAAGSDGAGGETFQWGSGFGDESLLEDLVRAAARDPSRLDPVRRLIKDLQASESSATVLPAEFLAVWDAVDAAARSGGEQ